VVIIQALDILRGLRRPLGNDVGRTHVAPRLIRQLPREYCCRLLVPVDDGLDVRLVRLLRYGVGVPRRRVAAKRGVVRADPTEVAPVVDEVEDELDAKALRGRNNVV
jgi:hypothetical protein